MVGLEDGPLTRNPQTNEARKFCETPNGQKVAVRVCNDATDPLTVTLTNQTAGTPFYLDVSTTTNAGASKDLITFAVPNGTTRSLTQVIVSTRQPGVIEILADGSIIGSGRTGPSEMTPIFKWDPARPFSSEETIIVRFTQVRGPTTDITAHVMALDT